IGFVPKNEANVPPAKHQVIYPQKTIASFPYAIINHHFPSLHHSHFATRHSPLATRYSLLAARYSLLQNPNKSRPIPQSQSPRRLFFSCPAPSPGGRVRVAGSRDARGL